MWLLLPFFMIIPFCCPDCYIASGQLPDQENVTAGEPMQVIQAQPVMTQAVSVQPLAAVATVVNPVAGAQQQPPQQQPQSPQSGAQASFEAEASGTRRGQMSLHDFLAECQLAGYEMAMQEMGAISAADVQDIEEEELVGMGMKKLEVRRLQRSLAALT